MMSRNGNVQTLFKIDWVSWVSWIDPVKTVKSPSFSAKFLEDSVTEINLSRYPDNFDMWNSISIFVNFKCCKQPTGELLISVQHFARV